MKAIRLHGTGDLQLHDESVPAVGPGEKLIRIKSVGVCGSDLHWFAEGGIGDAKLAQPLILGHEFAGETGDGQRVAIEPAIPCGHCEFCMHGHPNLCLSTIFAGHGNQDGALREYMAWNEKCLFPLPDLLTFEDGAMLEPLGVAVHSVDLAHLKTGMTVGVFGCGPIGLLIIQLAKLSGAANIIATDKFVHRTDAAKGYGADHVFVTGGNSRLSDIRAATTYDRGVDVAFEVAGVQETVDVSVAAVVPGGKVILAGIPDDDKTSFSASIARRKGLTEKLVRRMKHTYPRAIELVSKGLVDVRSIVTHRFALEQADEAFRVAERREGLKIMIEV
jgi:L-iditol 2-dehydrogenase